MTTTICTILGVVTIVGIAAYYLAHRAHLSLAAVEARLRALETTAAQAALLAEAKAIVALHTAAADAAAVAADAQALSVANAEAIENVVRHASSAFAGQTKIDPPTAPVGTATPGYAS